MADTLKNAVRSFDMQRNSEKQYAQTERPSSTRHICIGCRQTSPSKQVENVVFLSLDVPCPTCGGKVAAVTF